MTVSSDGSAQQTTTNGARQPAPSTDAGRSSSQSRTPSRRGKDQIAQVSELLHGRNPHDRESEEAERTADTRGADRQPTSRSLLDQFDDAGDEAEGGGDGATRQRPFDDLDLSDLKAIAAKLGTTPKALYENLKFQVGDDQLTLGQLKDAAQANVASSQETATREAALISREAGIARNEQIIASIWNDLQGKVNPETVRRVGQVMAQRDEQERRMIRQTMPELADPQVFSKFREDLVVMMGEYGFQPNELVIQDHRILLAMRDMLRFKRIIGKVASLEKGERKEPPSTIRSRRQSPTSKQTSQREAIQRARRGSEADKVSAISSLIEGR